MFRIRFQNGLDAPEIFLEEQFETEKEARNQLDELTRAYGTVPDAAAWVDGDSKPKHLEQEDTVAEEPAPEATGEVDPIPESAGMIAQPVGDEAERDAHDQAEQEERGELDDLTVEELDELAERHEVENYRKSDKKDDKLAALRAAGVS